MHGVSDVEKVSVSVTEEDSVTLNTGVTANQQEKIRWYYNDIRIAEITGDLSKICTDVQCNEGTERFRDRLKLDHQTGSLTIMNTSTADAGAYHREIIRNSTICEKIFIIAVHGVSAAERDKVKRKTVKDGESVTLYTGVIKNPSDVMMWYYNDTLIAEISGDQSQICTDDQCEERFRERLELDHQTGSLTITHTTNTHSGEYTLQINNSRFSITKIFSVFANDSHVETPLHLRSGVRIIEICSYVFLALLVVTLAACLFYYLYRNRNQNRQKYRVGIDLKIEGQSVFLHTGIKIQKGDHVKWMFGDKNFLIAEITEETQKRREFNLYDDAADENFLDRLELNKKTGSLIIRNSRDTDSGEYKLRITRNGKSSTKRFSVTVSCE
ncbi:V-set and immunoglobulin domain-containing protein 1-like [Pimephales promelas]|nr:V-set and immunoglobulin domain-containing protein 1-like [Pimephales promelas]